MALSGAIYELPKNIERYLAALSKLYAQEGKRFLQELIVNAQIRLQEAWSIDNLNGGTFGHALYLVVQDALFLAAIKQRTEIQEQIKNDLNQIHNVQNEFIEEVFLEMEVTEESDWRQESGLRITTTRTVAPEGIKRIWGDEGLPYILEPQVGSEERNEWSKRAPQFVRRVCLCGA